MIAPIEMKRILSEMTEEEQIAPDSWRKICLRHREIAKEEAEKLTDWILEMSEADKSARVIFLREYPDYENKYIDGNYEEEDLRGKIKVGCKLGEGITEKIWDDDQIEIMVKMLNEKPGIMAKLYHNIGDSPSVNIFVDNRKPN